VIASHSFFFSHHISTFEGGMVTTDDRHFYEMLLCLRAHGWSRNLPETNTLGATPGKFNFILPGYNPRPTEIQSAVGLVQLARLDSFVASRRANATASPWRSSANGQLVLVRLRGRPTPTVERCCETRPVNCETS
jgi:CDP-6-deoxy-D-xylo-4-hexulose-3-dehydrase